ncbi:MAG: M1 family aminopeptidase [Candidatus Eisenbacteria bacterium]
MSRGIGPNRDMDLSAALRPARWTPGLTPLPICALFVVATSALVSGADAEVIRLGEQVVPLEQTISLHLDPSRDLYSGRTDIRLDVRETAGTFRFHAESMTIESIELSHDGVPASAIWEMLDDATVQVTTEAPLDPGVWDFAIAFHDDYNTNAVSLYKMEADGEPYLFTQFEADDAREAFPCWDEPGFKIPYRLVLTVPEGATAVSNTPVESVTSTESGDGAPVKRVTFAQTKPIPSYLLAIAVGSFDSYPMEGLGVPGRIYTVRGQAGLAAEAASVTPAILHELESYFDRPYPYAKLDFLAVPDFWPGAMEHPGAITFADRVLLRDPRFLDARSRRGMRGTIAHELAHQWFGNLVTMEWWDDLWLNESFADWMGDKIVARLYPELGQDIDAAMDGQAVMEEDARVSVQPIRKTIEDTGALLQGIGVAYNKGKSVLRMFESWIGEEQFRAGVLDYIDAHTWSNARSADLWEALARHSDSGLPEAMETFIGQPGFPLIDVEPLGEGQVRLTQHRFHNAGREVADAHWILPLSIAYETERGVGRKTVLLAEESQVVDLDTGGVQPIWIHPKADGDGYYRWSLPSAELRAATEAVRVHGSVPERIDLYANATALLRSGDMSGPEYLEALRNLAEDADPDVLSSLTRYLKVVEDGLVDRPDSPAFAQYVSSLCRPALDRIGMEPLDGEPSSVEELRPDLLQWMGCQGRDPSVRAWADRSTRAFLEEPSAVPPALVRSALAVSGCDGDPELAAAFRSRFESATDPSQRRIFLTALGTFRTAEQRLSALNYALSPAVRSTEVGTITRGVMRDEAGHDLFANWMMENYDPYVSKIPPIYYPFLPFAGAGCSTDRLERVERFLSDPERAQPSFGRSFDQVRDEVRDCVTLHEREGKAVQEHLEGKVRPTAVGAGAGAMGGGAGSNSAHQ